MSGRRHNGNTCTCYSLLDGGHLAQSLRCGFFEVLGVGIGGADLSAEAAPGDEAAAPFGCIDAVGWANMPITDSGEVWWSDIAPSQRALFGSFIVLGEAFFRAITTAPVPLDRRALMRLAKFRLPPR